MNDTISRTAAIDICKAVQKTLLGTYYDPDSAEYISECISGLEKLPSAQPYTDEEIQKMQDIEQAQIEKAFELGREDAKAEIVRCKDCKFFKKYIDIPDGCLSLGIETTKDSYCSFAERRTDD